MAGGGASITPKKTRTLCSDRRTGRAIWLMTEMVDGLLWYFDEYKPFE